MVVGSAVETMWLCNFSRFCWPRWQEFRLIRNHWQNLTRPFLCCVVSFFCWWTLHRLISEDAWFLTAPFFVLRVPQAHLIAGVSPVEQPLTMIRFYSLNVSPLFDHYNALLVFLMSLQVLSLAACMSLATASWRTSQDRWSIHTTWGKYFIFKWPPFPFSNCVDRELFSQGALHFLNWKNIRIPHEAAKSRQQWLLVLEAPLAVTLFVVFENEIFPIF